MGERGGTKKGWGEGWEEGWGFKELEGKRCRGRDGWKG